MLDQMKNEQIVTKVSQLYKVLSDPTRLQILALLSEGERNVSAIVECLKIEQSAISHQLKLLRLNHLVKSRRAGKIIYYSLDDEHVLDILSQTIKHVQHTETL